MMLPVKVRRTNLPRRLLDPLADWEVFSDLDHLFDRVFGPNEGGYYPAEIWEDDENVYVEIELSGMTGEDVNVSFEDSILRIEGEKKQPERDGQTHLSERRYGKFIRTFHLPNVIDAESIKATFKDGVLTVTCAKRPESKPKKIEISVSK